MEEIVSWVENNIRVLKCLIERNKKYSDYPFTSDTAHYYKLMLLHKELECMMHFNDVLERFKLKRPTPNERKSEYFEELIKFERKQMPGFITVKTEEELMEYIKQLEWEIDIQTV
ncbi:hypothetical protein [Bacillus sp. 3255]|uniref:hypothetical protein n=1 Tax=Bacillus sp. 3255 TaxID=2817904 RepID=UPI0028547FE9|nr:hypothetical protein [Bacillus sp. 3255]MDR6885412.1 hypothetical protein [Bacillus sp. 3255]